MCRAPDQQHDGLHDRIQNKRARVQFNQIAYICGSKANKIQTEIISFFFSVAVYAGYFILNSSSVFASWNCHFRVFVCVCVANASYRMIKTHTHTQTAENISLSSPSPSSSPMFYFRF